LPAFFKVQTMKKIVLGIIVCLVSNFAFAQLQVFKDVGSGAPVMKDSFTGIKGDHFFQDFSDGIIIFSQKDSAENFKIRLNAFDQKLEYLNNGEVFEYRPKDVKGFIVMEEGRKAHYSTQYVIPQLRDKAFTKVLAQGDYTLLELKQKVVVDDPGATYGSNASKAFQNRISHYIVKDNEVIQYSARKKTLQTIFGDDFNRLKSIEKDSNLSLKDIDHLKVALTILNERGQ